MKLCLSVLLITMALCYSLDEARTVCPSLEQYFNDFFLGEIEVFKVQVDSFHVSNPVVEAALKLKECLDTSSPLEKRLLMVKALNKLYEKCKSEKTEDAISA
ncbi:secretoglobin family 1D member-like [Sorex fumeus]|uniref:secretoglobin family 1D member-like n=1 Tax=Sorex fumeus TaxID=62283 RepID=UPI0024ADBFAD|nr:secretoglobin family 1D member-like [Sorex fumeus]